MQNLFPISFPKFEDFFQDWFIDSIPNYHCQSAEISLQNDSHKLFDVVHPKYHNYKNIDWSQGKVFIFWNTALIPAPIHSDVYRLDERITLGHAVSFNLYNTSTVNFYDITDLEKAEKYVRPKDDVVSEELDTMYKKFENTNAVVYTTDKEPMETHSIGINETCIMNTLTPHQVLAEPKRINISVRCSHFNGSSWSDMIDFFKDDIKIIS